ncbi:hypothetical protein BJ138DRAFT_1004506 [Hygrophoropsis aurantiaca]|uniref:Uncharacterized protein n=1 Tax=Hygrophoropsis aurantiaca TaxID=72124 RepID=A0ACB8AHP9_9AGAM|nr:hypothetical protein BJ138DRAFT_1004506 [Hygrophoropsis aurantiaca]
MRRDETFYFANVVFLVGHFKYLYATLIVTYQVEDTLFRVPRQPFIDGSYVFRQRLERPVPPRAQEDGSSDENPLRLKSIKHDEFRQLLKVLFQNYGRPKNLPESFGEWKAVLKLSHRWGFKSARKQAIESLGAMKVDPVDKLSLSEKYDVDEWLLPALEKLANRREPIGVKDAEKLGVTLALKVAALREGPVPRTPSVPLRIGYKEVSVYPKSPSTYRSRYSIAY